MKTMSLILEKGKNRPTITEGLPVSKLEEPKQGLDGEITQFALLVGKTSILVCDKAVDCKTLRTSGVEVMVSEDNETYLVADDPTPVSGVASKRIMIFWSFPGYSFVTFGPDAKTPLARYDLFDPAFREEEDPVMQGVIILDSGECVFLHKDESDFMKIQNVEGRPIVTL